MARWRRLARVVRNIMNGARPTVYNQCRNLGLFWYMLGSTWMIRLPVYRLSNKLSFQNIKMKMMQKSFIKFIKVVHVHVLSQMTTKPRDGSACSEGLLARSPCSRDIDNACMVEVKWTPLFDRARGLLVPINFVIKILPPLDAKNAWDISTGIRFLEFTKWLWKRASCTHLPPTISPRLFQFSPLSVQPKRCSL